VVSAHLDTVFPEGTDVTVKEKDGAIVAPGIGDDSRGLAAMLSLIKAMNENQIATVGDIMFVGTVGEEELGNLRGVKALFRDHTDIDGFISIDGLGITRVVNQATGSHRYEFTFKGPGGTRSRSSDCRARSTPWAGRLRKSPSCSRHPIPGPRSPSAP
jgi:acetylornithine deacetylase/succinyl-diaminopimelate desuccinylase-like protein